MNADSRIIAIKESIMDVKKLCVVGLGYIGLPTASTFAKCGLEVIGMDNNPDIIECLIQGDIHIYEPGLRELVSEVITSGKLKVSPSVVPADAFIIAVPTPFHDDKTADMRYVQSAAESIVPHLKPGNLVILESTSPPMTTVNIVAPILQKSGLEAGVDFHLAYSPERVLPGKILKELIENARVIGGIDSASAEAGRELYQMFVKGDIILTDATTAEMVKLMENTSRDINIAIANEFCRLADQFGVDIWEAIEISNRHPRVNILKPGIGVGGHCISVDPWFLVEAAPEKAKLILTARKVNDGQPEFVCNAIEAEYGDLSQKRIGFLGLAFKPDVDDLRESPAVELAHLLKKKCKYLVACEPFKDTSQFASIPIVNDLDEFLGAVDLVVLGVNHQAFKTWDPVIIAAKTSARDIFDAVNGWDKIPWRAAGFNYKGLAKK